MTSYINVNSNPEGAEIFLNGVYSNFVTPNMIVFNNVPSWTGTVTLKLSGYPDYTQNVTLLDNQSITVAADFTTGGNMPNVNLSPIMLVGVVALGIGLMYVLKVAEYKFESSAAKRAGARYIAT